MRRELLIVLISCGDIILPTRIKHTFVMAVLHGQLLQFTGVAEDGEVFIEHVVDNIGQRSADLKTVCNYCRITYSVIAIVSCNANNPLKEASPVAPTMWLLTPPQQIVQMLHLTLLIPLHSRSTTFCMLWELIGLHPTQQLYRSKVWA